MPPPEGSRASKATGISPTGRGSWTSTGSSRAADREIAGDVAAEAQPESGRLIWKAEKGSIVRGAYYAEFEPRIPLTPYGGNDCPGFRSRPTVLPPPQR